MYISLLTIHSVFRWLVLLLLCWSVYRASVGYRRNYSFSPGDNALRHWTATVGHIQLILGILLYFKSPLVTFFWRERQSAPIPVEITFFALIHLVLMLASIVVLTVGSALAKRQGTDRAKFRTMFLWFSWALFILFIAIPWPFSPLAQRPYFRTF